LDEIKFSEESLAIIDLFKNTGINLFITGKAGTGKSTLLRHISSLDSEAILLAPTGIAAINVGGETVHSFFKLKPGYELDEAKHVRVDKATVARYHPVKTVIIDEISMIRADILDAIDVFLRRVKNIEEPFGAVRMIFIGDLFQLPPVLMRDQKVKFLEEYKSPYFFSANVFKQKDLFTKPFTIKTCELTVIYRQKDPKFTDLLNAIRTNTIDSSQLNILNKQVKADDEKDMRINLVSTNALASKLNLRKLQSVDSPEIKFTARHSGNIENLKPNDLEVILKKGAQIIFLNNDSTRRWVNGTIGKVKGLSEEIDGETDVAYSALEVELESGKTVMVTPHKWEISKYIFKLGRFTREEIGTFTQIPVKLAWAITIHKSQGKTFEKVKIDLGAGSFAHGQTYVALSRCTSLENIILSKPLSKSDVITDRIVVDYFNSQT
jgi:ATP-dependent exoDNAse (exonuclease V) alpha subunit